MMRFIRWLPAFFIICCSWYISSQSIVPMPSFNYADKAIHFVCYAGLAFWMAFAYKSKHLTPKDIGIPISQFKKLLIPIRNVYVVENKTNMLSFPAFENSIVICGMGFRVDILKEAKWLNEKKMFYWGDFDAQGFQILSEIRTHFPNIKSFLMDRETFDKFYEGDKGKETNVEKELCLTLEENDMFQYLKINNLRLEQEKIPYEYALERIPR